LTAHVFGARKSLNIFDALLLYYGAWDAQTQSRIGSQDVHREDDLKIKPRARPLLLRSPSVAARKHLPLSLALPPHTFLSRNFLSSIFMENLFQ
jgi:hypothetical protein